jgi:hypothetical protein
MKDYLVSSAITADYIKIVEAPIQYQYDTLLVQTFIGS